VNKQSFFAFLLIGTVMCTNVSCKKDSFASANSSKTLPTQMRITKA